MTFFPFAGKTFGELPDDLCNVSILANEEADSALIICEVFPAYGIVGGMVTKPSIPKPTERKQIEEKFRKQRQERNPINIEFYCSEEPDNVYFNLVITGSRRVRQIREEEEIALFLLAA